MTEDQTMRSLLAVHRTELDERDHKITTLESQLATADYWTNEEKRKRERAERNLELAEKQGVDSDKKITKLEGVIESLKLELADVRAQFTKAREAGDYQEATSETKTEANE